MLRVRDGARYVFISLILLICSGFLSAAEKPNVLLIVTDDQRPDTICALGNPIIKTPAIDRLVATGTSFQNAVCANPICTPSRAEILTGCHGIRNGVFDFGRTIDPELPTLPEPFADAGYKTWYCGKWHNNGRPSLHGYESTKRLYTGGGGKWAKPYNDYRGQPVTGYRGWIFRDEHDKPLPELGVGLTPNISELIADAAIDIIQDSGNQPFLAHVNFTAPHDPLLIPSGYEDMYDPKDIPLPKNFLADHPFDHGNRGGRDEVLLPLPRTEQATKADIAAYYAVISHLDAQVGRILTALDASDQTKNTLIVFASDHGLAVGSHGLRGKQNMYDHTMRVPMIFSGPGIPAGKQVSGHAYLRDIFPTLCHLANVEIPEVDGMNQVPVIKGTQPSVYPFTIGYFRDVQRMIRNDRWKLIEYPKVGRVQLFDLKNDPHELVDLSEDASHKIRQAELRLKLKGWLDSASL